MEISYSAIGSNRLHSVAHSGHRSIKISGDGLGCFSTALVSFVHGQYRQTTQRVSQLFSILTSWQV